MKKNTSTLLSLSVIVLLALVPVLQTLPLPLPSLLPEAHAQGYINLSNHDSNKTNATSAPYTAILSSFSVGTAGNRLLVVGVEANNQSVISVTFGGKGLKQAAGSFQNQDTELWYLVNPNGTNKIVVTMAGATQVVIGAYALYGVDQGNPIPTTATYWGTGNPKISLNTEFSNSTVLDSASIFGGATLSGSGCGTLGWDKNIVNRITGASGLTNKTAPGSVTCSWTASAGGNGWDDAAIEVKASGVNNPLTQISLQGKSTASGNSVSSVTIHQFKPGTGSNRLLVLAVETNNKAVSTTTKPTFGTATFTSSVSHFTHDDTEFWYLKNPSSTPADITVTFAGTTGFVVGVYAFSGVNQTSPIATTATNATANGNPTITINTKYYNSWVLDSPSIYGGSTLSSPTCTQQWDVNRLNQVTGASSYTIPIKPKSVTCTWTNSVSSNGWDDSAIEVRPYNPSTGVIIPLYNVPPLGGSNQWTNATNSHNAYPSVRMVGVVNFDNGNDVLNGTGWLAGVQNLQKAGIIVLGYVHTSFDCTDVATSCSYAGTVLPTSKIEQAMQNYSKFFNVNGTFFDEYSNYANSDNLTFYGKLNNYSKYYLNETLTVGNPGTAYNYTNACCPLQDFNQTVDTLNIYEENATVPPTNSYFAWESNFNKNLFSVLAYNVTANLLNSTYYNGTAKHVGYLYFTNDGGINGGDIRPGDHHDPWDQTTTYLNSTLGNLTHD